MTQIGGTVADLLEDANPIPDSRRTQVTSGVHHCRLPGQNMTSSYAIFAKVEEGTSRYCRKTDLKVLNEEFCKVIATCDDYADPRQCLERALDLMVPMFPSQAYKFFKFQSHIDRRRVLGRHAQQGQGAL